MSSSITKTPPAKRLINSMRSIEYNFSTSLADIIDNSISAKAKNIKIYTDTFIDSPYVEIIDDGIGMSYDELINALIFGSNREYKEDDLGRFGLGLKAASLAQCRKLQVCTKQNDKIYCMGYDLDHIEKTDKWDIMCYDVDEIERIPNIEILKNIKSGTIVKWEFFDFIEGESKPGQFAENLRRIISDSKKHIALVFHRFYDEINISFNNQKIEKRDPFLINSKPRQQTGITMTEYIEGSKVLITPYSLPFANTLTQEEKQLLGLDYGKSLYDDQGFYIYRNRRLIIWGSWLRMNQKNEFNKLARVQVDIPTSLDGLWMLDVKKSSAKIPEVVKAKLRIALKDSLQKSQKTIRRPGKVERDSANKIWLRREFGKEDVSYEINKENILYKELIKHIPNDAQCYLKAYIYEVEKNLPKFLIRDDMVENINIRNKAAEGLDEMQQELEDLLCLLPLEKRLEMLDSFMSSPVYSCLKLKYDEIRKKVME